MKLFFIFSIQINAGKWKIQNCAKDQPCAILYDGYDYTNGTRGIEEIKSNIEFCAGRDGSMKLVRIKYSPV